MATDGEPRLLGTLVVVVLRAKNLPDRSRLGKQNPYCAFRFGSQVKRTKAVAKGGQHPEFDDEVRFQIFEDTEDVIARKKLSATPSLPDSDKDGMPMAGPSTASVRDPPSAGKPSKKGVIMQLFADDPKEPKIIGECVVDLSPVMKMGEHDDWYTLMYKERYAGEVSLELTYFINSAPPMPPKVAKPVKRPLSHHSSFNSSASVSTMPLPPRRPMSMAPLASQGGPGSGSLPYRPRPYQPELGSTSDFGTYPVSHAAAHTRPSPMSEFQGHQALKDQYRPLGNAASRTAPWDVPPPGPVADQDNLATQLAHLSVSTDHAIPATGHGPHLDVHQQPHNDVQDLQHYGTLHAGNAGGQLLPNGSYIPVSQTSNLSQSFHQPYLPQPPPPSVFAQTPPPSTWHEQVSYEHEPHYRPYSAAMPPTSSFPHLADLYPPGRSSAPYGGASHPSEHAGPQVTALSPQAYPVAQPPLAFYPPLPTPQPTDPNASAPYIDNRPPLPMSAPLLSTAPPPMPPPPPPPPPRPYSTGHYSMPTSSFPQLQQDATTSGHYGIHEQPRPLPHPEAAGFGTLQPLANSQGGYAASGTPNLPTFATRSQSGRKYLQSLGQSHANDLPASDHPQSNLAFGEYGHMEPGRAISPQPPYSQHASRGFGSPQTVPVAPPPPVSPRPQSWIEPPPPLPVSMQVYHR